MKTRTIELHLNAVVQKWISSIKDKELGKIVEQNVFISGGAIASMYLGYPISDYDIYFKDRNVAYRLANYYIDLFFEKYKGNFSKGLVWVYDNSSKENTFRHRYKKIMGDDISDLLQQNIDTTAIEIAQNCSFGIYIKSAGAIALDSGAYKYFETLDPNETDQYEFLSEIKKEGSTKKKTPAYFPIYLSQNGVMLSNSIQLIFRFIGEPDEVHKKFDFEHATNYFHYAKKPLGVKYIPQVVLRKKALECLITKQLKYRSSNYPIAALCRVRKFLKRGFTISAGELLKMSYEISRLDLTKASVLYDQLMGVDLAYFTQLISMIENAKKNPDVNIDQAYISELIDQVFG